MVVQNKSMNKNSMSGVELGLHRRGRHGSNLDLPRWYCNAQAMPEKRDTSNKRKRAPRICVPNSERALFTVDKGQFVGVIQRLSMTGGSAILSKGPIPHGTMGNMELKTVFGKVSAHVEFLHSGADGIPLAQAFRFIAMDDKSAQRFRAAAEQMIAEGFSDNDAKASPGQTFNKLIHSVRRLAATISSGR